VVIVPAERVDAVVQCAEEREAKEAMMRQAIAQGATTAELLGLTEVLLRHGLT
jgi:regulator of RNase E activity RraA